MARIHLNTSHLYPELDIPDDEDAREQLSLRISRYPAKTLWMLIAIGVASLALDLFMDLLESTGHVVPGYWWRQVILLFIMLMAVYFTLLWTRNAVRRQLRRDLRDLGYPVCLNCGYDMRSLPEDRCPECGMVAEPLDADQSVNDNS